MRITVSKETALALLETGWKKKCEFGVYLYADKKNKDIMNFGESQWRSFYEIDRIYEAPTAEELFTSLKVYMKTEYGNAYLKISKCDDDSGVIVGYSVSGDIHGIYLECEKTLSEALAKLWINHPECRKS